jgi:signal transduction histidine kinase/ActR/RegA family two-component response regulator
MDAHNFQARSSIPLPVAARERADSRSHLVQFYEDDAFLVESLADWFSEGFNRGDSCVFIGTEAHRIGLENQLTKRGLALDLIRGQKRYVRLNAARTLSKFMVDEWPDEARFIRELEDVLATLSKRGNIRAFGEMVALLRNDGNPDAAIRLEQIWNGFIKKHALLLYCAYPLSSFSTDVDGTRFLEVCGEHTSVLPAESYSRLNTPEERLAAITLLQQKANRMEQRAQALEEELKIRLAELAQADQRKNEFLAMLGHELRNPLSAVLDAIVTAQLDEARRDRALSIARRQTDQLSGLVDDLLDVGRITQGRIALRKEPLNVAEIVKQAVEEARCLIVPGQNQLTVMVSPQALNAQIEADAVRMRQVITNLIDNASKFTPLGGRIDVVADLDDHEVVFRVRDSGIGISPDLLPHVFDLFTQSERSLDRSHGGLGIGLTVVKRLVEMHGGRVEARSAGQAKGSEFEVRLPLATMVSAPVVPAPARTGLQGQLRVLIVEDNRDAAEALTMLLELFGYQPTVVPDGPKAIEAVRNGSFDIGLVDIGLPGIDGYEVARRIRSIPNNGSMMLVAVTGYGQDSDKQRALSAGFDEHLTKPVKIERLQAVLSRPHQGALRLERPGSQ